jgi:hypothetical protein
MLELAKTPPTEAAFIRLQFWGPSSKKREAIEHMCGLGFQESDEETNSWRTVFPEYTEAQLPGVVLRGARYREGFTQKQLSQLSGIPQRHLSEMENGKRPIGKKNAELLAKALQIPSYKIFL